MAVKKSEDQFRVLLVETILAMCRNTLNYDSEVSVEGLIGITLDKEEIFLVTINQLISNPDAVSSTGKRKRKRKRKQKKAQESNSEENDSDNQSGTEEESNKRSRKQSDQSDHSSRQDKSDDKDNNKSSKSDRKGSRSKNGEGNDDLVFLKEEPGASSSGPDPQSSYSFPHVSEALSSSNQSGNQLRTSSSSHSSDIAQRDNQYLSPGVSRPDHPVAGTSQDRTYAPEGNRRRSRESPRGNHGNANANVTHLSLMNLQNMVSQTGNRMQQQLRHSFMHEEAMRGIQNHLRPQNPTMQRFVRPPGPGVRQQFANPQQQHLMRNPGMHDGTQGIMGVDQRMGQMEATMGQMEPRMMAMDHRVNMDPRMVANMDPRMMTGQSMQSPTSMGPPPLPRSSPNQLSPNFNQQRSPYSQHFSAMQQMGQQMPSQSYNHMRPEMQTSMAMMQQRQQLHLSSQSPRYQGVPFSCGQSPPQRQLNQMNQMNQMNQFNSNTRVPFVPTSVPNRMQSVPVSSGQNAPSTPRSPEPIVIGPQESQASECLTAMAQRMGPNVGTPVSQPNVTSSVNSNVSSTSPGSSSANLRLSPHYINILDSLMSDMPGQAITSSNPEPPQPQQVKYNCPVCSLDCQYLHELLKHLSSHSPNETSGPLVCPLRCAQQAYGSLQEYHHHLMSHFNNSTCVCDKCNARFPFTHELERHKVGCLSGAAVESPVVSQLLSNLFVPYCNDCKQTYQTKEELNTHLVDTHGSTIDETLCEMCNKTFEGSLRLRWHLQEDHNITTDEYQKRLETGTLNALDDDDLEILDVQNPRKRKNDP